MASTDLEEIMKQAQALPPDEQLRLIAYLAARVLDGEEQLVIQNYELYKRFVAQQLHRDLGRKLGAEADSHGLNEEELIASMEEDRQAVYAEMYGEKGESK